MDPFDLLNAPLKGRNLIEANAGTGKTYAISGLFLRLVVESALPVNEILVMTYTVAATEELKDRIRTLLHRALKGVQQGHAGDSFLSSLLERGAAEGRIHSFRRLLSAALRDFDEAAIFTIHGFCQRTLQENAFESSSAFDVQLITDSSKIFDSILQDFWRRNFYEAPQELVAYALTTGHTLNNYREFLRLASSRPDLRIVPDLEAPDRDFLERDLTAYRREMNRLRKEWEVSREIIRGLLRHGSLNAKSYGGLHSDRYIAELDAFLENGAPWFPLPKVFARFNAEQLARSCKKGLSPPEHPFFESCRQMAARGATLEETLDRFLLRLKKVFLQNVQTELSSYKVRRNILFFDDLLTRLRDALHQPEGATLAEALRKKYRAALIDEFQDTDPVQYDIVKTVFLKERKNDAGGAPIFLIGDPKQAIYSFRGADIFAYMAAAKEVNFSYTLRENWRSDPSLLAAVNSIFHNRQTPFVYDEITFSDSKPAPGGIQEALFLSGKEELHEEPLQLWIVPADEDRADKPLAKGSATPRILRAVTAEIARLLEAGREGRALIGRRRLEAGDVAVLVRKNREARLIQEALANQAIPAILHSRDNLFKSLDAADMEILLQAIASNNERFLSAALLTPLIGMNVASLFRLKNDERQWEACLQRFRAYHRLWQEEGFMRMMRTLLQAEQVRTRLLSRQDGERRLTNILHLTEVLHRESLEHNRGMRALIRRLAEMRASGKAGSDEHQLRLESDAHAVKIVTIHKSKGLGYPVVFCPFVWEGEEAPGSQGCVCHGGDDQDFLLCDIGLPPRPLHRLRCYREGLAERVRLLYVALTRAKHRCYLVWGRFNKAGNSAPAYLFHDRMVEWDEKKPEKTLAAANEFQEQYGKLTDRELSDDLKRMASSAASCIHIGNLPDTSAASSLRDPEQEMEFSCRQFSREIDRTGRFASFSSLVYGTYFPQDETDRQKEEVSPAQAPSDWKHLPTGTSTGNLLHGLLEHLDFTEKDEFTLRNRVTEALAVAGYDPRWEDSVMSLLRNVLTLSLTSAEGGSSFRLADIDRQDRVSELGFYFSLQPLTPEKLRNLFRDITAKDPGNIPPSWEIELNRLSFSPVRGWLRGFIDLVFTVGGRYYLLDWKSNDLGDQPGCYERESLQNVMVRKHYILQYHLYALALHTYLKRRIPGYMVETHFGGVYYMFLRGIDPARGMETGVYFDRPSEACLTAFYDELIEKSALERIHADVVR